MKKITLLTTLDIEGHIHDDHLLVKELKNCGYNVLSKPWETLEDQGEDLFIIRTTWNYTQHLDKFLNCLERINDRLWNPLSLVKWNANKRYLSDFYTRGLGVIPLCLADNQKSLELSIEQLGGDEFIAKPLIGASAKGLIRFHRSKLPRLDHEMIIQKFYPEIVKGEISLIYFNGKFAYAVKKTPKAGEIRVQEEYGGIITSYAPSTEEFKLSEDILAEIPEKWLYARVDIVPGIGVIELECIEPSLFFGSCERGAKFFAEAIAEI